MQGTNFPPVRLRIRSLLKIAITRRAMSLNARCGHLWFQKPCYRATLASRYLREGIWRCGNLSFTA
uniref:Uncharacterized protein n=1 Tax=Picea sitchensis TaxID=3332 RepID=A9P116_PICSI|nr:unknown [Picea sitchensis]